MARAIERLVYCSRAAQPEAADAVLAEVLRASQRNNHRDGLTGALACHDGRFIQVIEGPPEALDRLQARLAGDPRHTDMVVLGRSPVVGRLFDLWTMASACITPELKPTMDALMAEPTPSPARTVALLMQAVSRR